MASEHELKVSILKEWRFHKLQMQFHIIFQVKNIHGI